MRNILTNKKGFTLFEIIIYMTATAMLTVFMMTYLVNIWSRFHYMENVRTVQYSAHTIMDLIIKDIRNSKNVNVLSSSELILVRSDNTEVHYFWDSNPNVNTISLSDGITTEIISNNVRVSDLNFGYGINSDLITVDLTVKQKTDKVQVSPYSLSLNSKAVSRRTIY